MSSELDSLKCRATLFRSRVTAKLFPSKFPGFNLSLLRVVAIGRWHSLSLVSPTSGSATTVSVMALDANHCPGKGPLSRFGRKLAIHDENRRATYNISLAQPVTSSESIFSTFEGEMKQLIPVGLYTDYSYARSLARFAATLGSVAWKVASKRIEQDCLKDSNLVVGGSESTSLFQPLC